MTGSAWEGLRGNAMDEQERWRLQRHVYPRPPEDVIDEAILWGFRRPEGQIWIRVDDFHTAAPAPFRCGGPHRANVEGPVCRPRPTCRAWTARPTGWRSAPAADGCSGA